MKSFFNNVCLLISHNLLDREVFGRALKEVSPESVYCVARDGREALSLITDGHVIPNLIFVELDMPNMDGVEFLKRLKSITLYKGIPVIVHTNLGSLNRHHEILEAGAMAIYSKAYELEGVSNILYFFGLPDLRCLPDLALLHMN